MLASGQLKRMEEIQIGERVAVGGGKFSEVFMFTHKSKAGTFEFVSIRTDTGNEIRLTPGHYLLLNGMYLPASDAPVGDMAISGRFIVPYCAGAYGDRCWTV